MAEAGLADSLDGAGFDLPGTAFGPVATQAEQLQRQYGILASEQLKVASSFGAIAQGAGYTEQASADLANKLTMRAADLAQQDRRARL